MNRIIVWESWALAEAADRRFRLIVVLTGGPILALAAWAGMLQFEARQTKQGAIEGARVVELTLAQTEITPVPPPSPAPAAEAAANAPDRAVAVPKLPERPKQIFAKPAGKLAEDAPSILVVKRGQLDTGNQHPNLITSQQPLVAVSNPPRNTQSVVPPPTVTEGRGAPPALPGKPKELASPGGPNGILPVEAAGDSPSAQAPLSNRPRDIQEVQQVFGRNGASLNAIYVRRASGDLSMGAGKIIIQFTVAPNGTVTDCSVVSSTFKDPVFENRIVAQIRLFRFLPKNVPVFVSPHYAIEFYGA